MFKKINLQIGLAVMTFALLICLVIIQILFMVRAASLEEKHFNHRVVLALREARNEIAREANACNNMHNYVCGNTCATDMQYIHFQMVESIIQSNLYIHKISLDYKFEFVNEKDNEQNKICVTCYEQSLNGLLAQNGIKLIIEFPERSKFLLAQLGTLFYLSIASILFVMFSFVITYRLFDKKKRLLANTKDFIDNMVHEFQTPIANIKFASSLIKKKSQNSNDEKISEFAQLIQDENKKIVNHVSDILKVATMNSEEMPFEEFNMNDLLASCSNDFVRAVEERGGSLTLNLKSNIPIIKGSQTYLRHAVSNILDNALKYCEEKPLVVVSSYNKKGKLFVSVKDNGVGIASGEFGNIFEKYYRIPTGNVHNTKGFGLGLDFVKNIVEKHKGIVSVKSEVGYGSEFTIILKHK